MNLYVQDILSQPAALHNALGKFSDSGLIHLADRLRNGEFDRIVISGMGASYNAAYPAYLQLTGGSIPVIIANAAELLHYSHGLISERTLLWLNSQSGKSIELVRLLEQVRGAQDAGVRVPLVACVNDIHSPLATAADLCLPIHAGLEASVSTRTYLNMLAVNLLAAVTLTGGDVSVVHAALESAAEASAGYLAQWQERLAELDSALGPVQDLVILGRGASLAAVWNGSLINKEAAKCAFEGMHAADFRHGPLELVSPNFTAIILAGSSPTRLLNRELAKDILQYGGVVHWLGAESGCPDGARLMRIPEVAEIALPLVEILPLQLLSLLMAGRKGVEPGVFRHVSKITSKE